MCNAVLMIDSEQANLALALWPVARGKVKLGYWWADWQRC